MRFPVPDVLCPGELVDFSLQEEKAGSIYRRSVQCCPDKQVSVPFNTHFLSCSEKETA